MSFEILFKELPWIKTLLYLLPIAAVVLGIPWAVVTAKAKQQEE